MSVEKRTPERQQIDRMVDGELNTEQQRALLLDCEARGNWRNLALAYVESQTLAKELKNFASPAASTQTVGGETRGDLVQPTSNDANGPQERSTWKPWSLAAAILLSLGLGYGAGWTWKLPTSGFASPGQIVQSPRSSGFDGAPGNGSASPTQSMQMMVANPVTRELQQIQLPLVSASDLPSGWEDRLQPTRLPEDVLRELNAGGLNIHQTRTMTPVRLRDGRRVIVPVDYFIERPFQ